MKRDANLLFSVFAIDALYLVSFFLPVRPLGKDFPEGDNEFGWDVFVQVIQAILNFDDRSWTAFELFLPNLLLWMGIICLWGRVPVVSFVTGISATAIAAKSLHWWQLFPYPRPPENLPSFLNANLDRKSVV